MFREVQFFFLNQYGCKLLTSKTDVCNTSTQRRRPFSRRCVWPFLVIFLCLQIDRANLRFGQMAISEKLHRRLTYTNLGSSLSPSSDLKLYWWTLTPTQLFFRICDDEAVWVQYLEAVYECTCYNNNLIVKYGMYSTKMHQILLSIWTLLKLVLF